MRLGTLRAVSFLAALVCGTSAAVAADGAPWTLIETSGAVNVAAPMGAAHLASTRESLGLGTVLTTGGDGRAVLSNGMQQIVVGPNSRMSLPGAEKRGVTHILQDVGTLLFKVDKRPEQHFSVETPFVAAVVKGTTFTVTAGALSNSVHVVEGLVEVNAREGNARQYVSAGMTAIVNRANPTAITMSGANEFSGAPTEGIVPEDSTSEPSVPKLQENKLNDARATGAPASTSTATFEIAPGLLDMATLTDGFIQSNAAGAANPTAIVGGEAQVATTSSSGGTITIDVGETAAAASSGGAATGAGVAGTAGSALGSTVSTLAGPGSGGLALGGGNGSSGVVGNALGSTLGTVDNALGGSTGSSNSGSGNGNALGLVTNVLGGTSGSSNSGNGNGSALGLGVIGTNNTGSNGGANGNGNALGAGVTGTNNTGSNTGGNGNGGALGLIGGVVGGITGNSGNGNSNGNGNGNSNSNSNSNSNNGLLGLGLGH